MRPSVVILIAFAALAVGIGVGVALAPTPVRVAPTVEARTPTGSTSASAEELARWKDEILSELRRPRDVPKSADAPASQRAAVVTPEDPIDRRLSEIERRLDALASGQPTYQRTPAWRNARGPGYPSIDAITSALRAAEQNGRLVEVRDQLASRSFYLWTPDEVIAAFGPPRSVGAQHGVDFSYGTFDLKDVTCTLWFSFQAGLISEVWYDCHDRK